MLLCIPCSVNTPTKTTGIGAGKAADLTYWEGAARLIASVTTSSKIVVEKSTVPVKTAEAIGKVGSDSVRFQDQLPAQLSGPARQDPSCPYSAELPAEAHPQPHTAICHQYLCTHHCVR